MDPRCIQDDLFGSSLNPLLKNYPRVFSVVLRRLIVRSWTTLHRSSPSGAQVAMRVISVMTASLDHMADP